MVGLNGIGHFMDDREARSESIFRRIDYVVELVGPEHAGIGLDYPFPVAGRDIDGLLVRHPEFWPPSAGYGTGLYRNAEPEQFPDLTELMLGPGTRNARSGVSSARISCGWPGAVWRNRGGRRQPSSGGVAAEAAGGF